MSSGSFHAKSAKPSFQASLLSFWHLLRFSDSPSWLSLNSWPHLSRTTNTRRFMFVKRCLMRSINYSQPFWFNLRAKINCHNNFSRQRTWAQSEAQSRLFTKKLMRTLVYISVIRTKTNLKRILISVKFTWNRLKDWHKVMSCEATADKMR